MRRAAIGIAALALVAAGCGGGGPKVYKDPFGTIDVRKGQEFTIQLPVNASVGYGWELLPTFEFEPSKIKVVSVKSVYPNDHRTGEGGVRRYTLKAIAIGNQTLIFQHSFRGKLTDRRVLTIAIDPASG